MKYTTVAETAKKWNMSERSIRNYCALGKIDGAILKGKTWEIPEDAVKPARINAKKDAQSTLLDILTAEKNAKISGGIYHQIQVDMTYNSNHIEGSRLTHDQTRYIFETNTIGLDNGAVNVDDIKSYNRDANQGITPHFKKRNQRQPQGLVCGRRLQKAAQHRRR